MKKCLHIDLIFDELNQPKTNINQSESNNDMIIKNEQRKQIQNICTILLELNHIAKSNQSHHLIINHNNNDHFLSQENDLNDKLIKNLKYLNCENCSLLHSDNINENDTLVSRLHLCATCLYIGCFSLTNNSHIEQHSLNYNHYITIDIIYGAFYCFKCKDFQYNQDLEEFLRESFLKENFLPHGKFSEWEPPQKTLKLLKKLSTINNSTNTTNKQNNTPNGSYALSILKSFRLKKTSIIGLRGLINLGNTCFMNCILQTLTHIPSLRDYFLGDQHVCNYNSSNFNNNNNNNNGNKKNLEINSLSFGNYNNNNIKNKNLCLVCEIVTLFQEFYSGKRSPYIPYRLLHQVWTQVKHLAGYEQQDAHEFFIAALNAIHKNFIENDNNCINLNKDKSKFINYNNCHCIIDKIFTGGLQSDVICSNCKDISLDIFKTANKNLKSSNGSSNNEPLKLEDCLFKFTLPEILTTFNCSNCKSSREAKKQFTMKKLPVVCCFHLKRFEQSNRIHKKIFDHISFPEILDMNPFMSNNLNSDLNDQTKLETNKYFLFAVVNHHGTLESGHYTCFIRLKNEQWFKCDDHIISKTTLNDVMNSEGYLLFYHKIWNDYE